MIRNRIAPGGVRNAVTLTRTRASRVGSKSDNNAIDDRTSGLHARPDRGEPTKCIRSQYG